MTAPANRPAAGGVWKVISGGQTGADRAGLDYALEAGLALGGWCPKGRLAEDGQVPACYPLVEASQAGYAARTRLNVDQSDGTLLVYKPPLAGGSALTLRACREAGKPVLAISYGEPLEDAARRVQAWLDRQRRLKPVEVLNVAGSRESRAPGIRAYVVKLLRLALVRPYAVPTALEAPDNPHACHVNPTS